MKTRVPLALGLLLVLLLPLLGRAQSACMLLPVPLAQRVQRAALVVEARVAIQQPERAPSGHIVTRNSLEVFKVFRGQLPAGPLRMLTAGGTLGGQAEVASGALALRPGQQGIFLLEADPTEPGELRAYAGPQGFIEYRLTDLTASEPLGHYASIAGDLYGAVVASAGTPYRVRQPNAALAAASQRTAQRPAAPLATTAPVISSFSPGTVTAGTSTSNATSSNGVLTITGTGFGAAQGNGFVQFRNADNPGPAGSPNYTQPLASDYLSWTDTQIQVRVPARSATGNTAGTGAFQVADNSGALATSPSALTVTYSLISVASGGQTYRLRLVGTAGGNGGYALQYASSFPAAAKAPFERALNNWRCQTGMNRSISATPAPTDTRAQDGVNVVRFGASGELPAGVLGITYSYYSACSANGGPFNWTLTETDYVFNTNVNWNYDTTAPGSNQADFESVALHEEGHGEQLTHIISSTGVMNYLLTTGQTRRTLDAGTDVAGGNDIISYSTSATADQLCGSAAFSPSACPLPVQLTAFGARYQPGQGTQLSWATASELNSAIFIVESQEAGTNASAWQEVARQPAAGTSLTPHQYQAHDPRPLAGPRYYRLRQVDLDGTTAFSPVVSVSAPAAALAAYPNPATGLVQLSGPLAPGATAQLRLLDATGRTVLRATGPAGQAAFELPLTGVPAGLYVLDWDGGAGHTHLRLVVE